MEHYLQQLELPYAAGIHAGGIALRAKNRRTIKTPPVPKRLKNEQAKTNHKNLELTNNNSNRYSAKATHATIKMPDAESAAVYPLLKTAAGIPPLIAGKGIHNQKLLLAALLAAMLLHLCIAGVVFHFSNSLFDTPDKPKNASVQLMPSIILYDVAGNQLASTEQAQAGAGISKAKATQAAAIQAQTSPSQATEQNKQHGLSTEQTAHSKLLPPKKQHEQAHVEKALPHKVSATQALTAQTPQQKPQPVKEHVELTSTASTQPGSKANLQNVQPYSSTTVNNSPAPPATTGSSSGMPTIEAQSGNPRPLYPAFSIERGQEGTVTVLVVINTQGKAERVKVQSSSGFPLLDKSATTAVKKWKFKAEHYQETNEVLVPVEFKLTTK